MIQCVNPEECKKLNDNKRPGRDRHRFSVNGWLILKAVIQRSPVIGSHALNHNGRRNNVKVRGAPPIHMLTEADADEPGFYNKTTKPLHGSVSL
jgi:hypothetical protein